MCVFFFFFVVVVFWGGGGKGDKMLKGGEVHIHSLLNTPRALKAEYATALD